MIVELCRCCCTATVFVHPDTRPVRRRMFPASQWSAEINAAIASAGFFWLVGDSELRTEPVEVWRDCAGAACNSCLLVADWL